MNIGTPVESLASSVYAAINNPEILPDITRDYRGEKRTHRPNVTDLHVVHFPQMWGSTSLGFNGMGGAAMSTAYTTVIICEDNAAVFFGGRHAYSVDNIDKAFNEDLKNLFMPSVTEAAERYK